MEDLNPVRYFDKLQEEGDIKRQPFNERLVEMLRGERDNCFDLLFKKYSEPVPERLICMQYNYKQKPKISYGIALYNLTYKRWFVILPKYTIEMRAVMQGMYNESMLPFLIDQLFEEEVCLLLDYQGDYTSLYKMIQGREPGNELCRVMFEEYLPRIRTLCQRRLQITIGESTECQYVFPKGRPLPSELIFQTARRELEEETNIRILFNGNLITEKNLSRGMMVSGARGSCSQNITFNPTTKYSHWEPCDLEIPLESGDPVKYTGHVCREFVTHSHSDVTGKIYKTTLWICAFESPGLDLDLVKRTHNWETRGGTWMKEEDLVRRSRVKELFLKCDMTLNKFYPYLSL